MLEYKEQIKNLSWKLSEEIQNDTIKTLSQINEEQVQSLIRDCKKDCWYNAVKVIKQIGYPRNKLAIPSLIWLFQDTNWPGVSMALEILQGIDLEEVIPHLEEALIKAAEEQDYMWIGGLQRLVDHLNICKNDFSKDEVYCLLELADW